MGGIVDSMAPFACAQASPSDAGNGCTFQVSYGTIFGSLIGSVAATIWQEGSLLSLSLPFLLYCLPFPVVCLAVAFGGRWASPWSADVSGSVFVSLLITVMRTIGPLARSLVIRLTQTCYEPRHVESM